MALLAQVSEEWLNEKYEGVPETAARSMAWRHGRVYSIWALAAPRVFAKGGREECLMGKSVVLARKVVEAFQQTGVRPARGILAVFASGQWSACGLGALGFALAAQRNGNRPTDLAQIVAALNDSFTQHTQMGLVNGWDGTPSLSGLYRWPDRQEYELGYKAGEMAAALIFNQKRGDELAV